MSVSELARAKRRDKALISRQVAALEQAGRLTTYAGDRNVKLVDVAAFDLARGEVGDAFKLQAAATSREMRDPPAAAEGVAPGAPAEGSLAAEQRRKLSYESRLKELELAERLGLLVSIAGVVEALREGGDAIVQLIDRLPLRAAEMAAAVSKEGEPGARALFKTIAFDLRKGIADAWKKIEERGAAEESAGEVTAELPDDEV
jgi:hypothetical protein